MVRNAPTIFGAPFEYDFRHDDARTITIDATQPLPDVVRFVYPCRLGSVHEATADGLSVSPTGNDVWLPAGFQRAVITYG
jgi:hypothetical protein